MVQIEKKELKKDNISLFEAFLYVLGLVIGSGVFLKPTIVLQCMGSTGGAITIWIAGGVMTICAALSIAEIASYITKVGGLYAYINDLYGEIPGFLFGWVNAIIYGPGTCAALGIAFAAIATFFVPMSGMQQKLLAVLIVVLITTAQIIATRFGVWLQTLATIGKLIPIGLIILFGLKNGTVHDFSFANSGMSAAGAGIGVALLGVLWAYDGWINACSLAGEIKKPHRNLPIAIVGGVLTITAIYSLFNVAIFNTMSTAAVVGSSKIGVDVSVSLFGGWAAILITIGMLVSVFGTLNASFACAARITFAMGQKRQLPMGRLLGAINAKLDTPIYALVFQAIVTTLLIASGTFEEITNMVVFVMWIFFSLGVFGVFILRKKYPRKVGCITCHCTL